MLQRAITRRLVIVPLDNNNHGKTRMIRALVRQGERRKIEVVQRGPRRLTSPWGRSVDALIIPRSYQETLAGEFGSRDRALDAVDSSWRQRDLVIFPSHLVRDDCEIIIGLAHGAGFDAIAINVLLEPGEILGGQQCLALPWDERWTLANDRVDRPEGLVDALGHDLWTWITAALAPTP
jgi:hypothetical protein